MTGKRDEPETGADGHRILCERTLPVGDPEHVVYDVFADVENAPLRADLPAPAVAVRYLPVVDVEAVTRATFETGNRVVHRLDRRDHVVVEADDRGPRLAPDDVVDLVGVETVPLARAQDDHGGSAVRFTATGEALREWVTDRLCDLLAEEVTYTDGGETFTTECRPDPEDVSLRSMRPLYVPRVEAAVELGEYRHHYEYDAAGDRHVVRDDGVHRCDHCETAGPEAATYTYCEHCGSIGCEAHVKTEHLTGEPVCVGCAVTEAFPLTTKYFADEGNRETFRERYREMSISGKLREHLPLVG